WDDENSGFFFTSDDHESLLARGKNPVDGAQPSGNSVSVQNLIYLAGELDNKEYLEHADGTIRSVSGILSNSPSASPRMVIAVGQRLDADSE
ncbi:MAG: thioredoxin, partial [Planctomycetota bacterium]|nr:thioredoxin [Planctomycetota bacterium]